MTNKHGKTKIDWASELANETMSPKRIKSLSFPLTFN